MADDKKKVSAQAFVLENDEGAETVPRGVRAIHLPLPVPPGCIVCHEITDVFLIGMSRLQGGTETFVAGYLFACAEHTETAVDLQAMAFELGQGKAAPSPPGGGGTTH